MFSFTKTIKVIDDYYIQPIFLHEDYKKAFEQEYIKSETKDGYILQTDKLITDYNDIEKFKNIFAGIAFVASAQRLSNSYWKLRFFYSSGALIEILQAPFEFCKLKELRSFGIIQNDDVCINGDYTYDKDKEFAIQKAISNSFTSIVSSHSMPYIFN